MPVTDRFFSWFDDGQAHDEELPAAVREELSHNVRRLVGALTLQHVGDRIVDPKTVLAWLLAAVGSPASLIGLLVPVREAGSLIPQAGLVPVVRRSELRKWVWVVGAVGQASAVTVMAVSAAVLSGAAAGIAILASLGLFAFARSFSSIAFADVLGRTIPQGQRGQVTGLAVLLSGIVAITLGLGLRLLGGEDVAVGVFALLLFAAAIAWLAAAAVFRRVVEEPGSPEPPDRTGTVVAALNRLREDAPFRTFVSARALLLVSALSPPFVVQLSVEEAGAGLSGLGWFVVAGGVASLLGGRVWGRQADRSSRRTMMLAAGTAAGVIVLLLLALMVPALRGAALLYPLAHLGISTAHVGARVGRKTYLVDMAEGDRRTEYVAVSNTAMGIILLAVGVISAGVAAVGLQAALLLLAGLGAAGVVVAARLPEVGA